MSDNVTYLFRGEDPKIVKTAREAINTIQDGLRAEDGSFKEMDIWVVLGEIVISWAEAVADDAEEAAEKLRKFGQELIGQADFWQEHDIQE